MFFLFLPITFEIVHACLSIHNVNTYEVLSNIKFTFDSHNFFYIHDYLSIHCLAIILAVKNAYKVLSNSHKHFTFNS